MTVFLFGYLLIVCVIYMVLQCVTEVQEFYFFKVCSAIRHFEGFGLCFLCKIGLFIVICLPLFSLILQHILLVLLSIILRHIFYFPLLCCMLQNANSKIVLMFAPTGWWDVGFNRQGDRSQTQNSSV